MTDDAAAVAADAGGSTGVSGGKRKRFLDGLNLGDTSGKYLSVVPRPQQHTKKFAQPLTSLTENAIIFNIKAGHNEFIR